MTVFEQVKKLTKSRSKTMKQVTTDLGYSENYFYSLKSGKQPTAERLSEIADYFNVSVDYLLGREEKTSLAEKYGVFAFDGEPVTDEEVEFLKSVLAAKRAAENK